MSKNLSCFVKLVKNIIKGEFRYVSRIRQSVIWENINSIKLNINNWLGLIIFIKKIGLYEKLKITKNYTIYNKQNNRKKIII